MARGEGAIVEDVDGNVSSTAPPASPSTRPATRIRTSSPPSSSRRSKFLHMSGTDFYYEPQVRLAEELGRIVPIDGGVQGRSSATRAPRPTRRRSSWRAITPKRPFLIAFLGSFHGRTLGSLGADVEPRRAAQGLRAGDHARRVPRAVPGRLSRRRRRVAGAGRRRVDRFDRGPAFVHLVSPDEVAAIVVEPIQGEGGYIVPPIEFHQRLRRAGDEARHPAGRRRSAVGHGPHRQDVRARSTSACSPTSSSIAKGIASGLPLGVTAARADVMDWTPGAHASTFGGNPVACAAALGDDQAARRRADRQRRRRSASTCSAGCAS